MPGPGRDDPATAWPCPDLLGTDSHLHHCRNGLRRLPAGAWAASGPGRDVANRVHARSRRSTSRFRLTGELPSGATATDRGYLAICGSAQRGMSGQVRPVPRRRRGPRCRSPTAPPSATCHRNSGRPARSSPSTNTLDCMALTGRPRTTESLRLVEGVPRAGHGYSPAREAFSEELGLDLSTRGAVDRRLNARRTRSRWPRQDRVLPRRAAQLRAGNQPGQRPGRHLRRLQPVAKLSEQRRGPRTRSRSPWKATTTSVDHGSVVIACILDAEHVQPPRSWSAPPCWPRTRWTGPEPQALGEDHACAQVPR